MGSHRTTLAIALAASLACGPESGTGTGDGFASSGAATSTDEGQGGSDTSAASGQEGGNTGEDGSTTAPGDVVCRTPATETYVGDLYITPDTLDAIDLLANVRRIDGKLEIYDTELTDLDFMICVEEIAKDITLFNNDQLVSTAGLDGITLIGDAPPSQQDADPSLDPWGNVMISDHAALVAFDGLSNLHEIPLSLLVSGNASLTDLSGLDGVQAVGSGVVIRENPMLCVSHIEAIFGDLVGDTTMAGNADDC